MRYTGVRREGGKEKTLSTNPQTGGNLEGGYGGKTAWGVAKRSDEKGNIRTNTLPVCNAVIARIEQGDRKNQSHPGKQNRTTNSIKKKAARCAQKKGVHRVIGCRLEKNLTLT